MTNAFPLAWPEGWPRTPLERQAPSRFKTTFGRAYDAITYEVRRINGGSLVISTNVPLRNDGKPYASFNLNNMGDHGVAVYFQLKKKPIVIACDKFWRVHENLKAIAKTIEAIRGIERWGASELMHRAFDGFAALPPPNEQKHWTTVLGVAASASPQQIEEAWRAAARKHHPDRGGSQQEMAQINRARDEARASLGY